MIELISKSQRFYFSHQASYLGPSWIYRKVMSPSWTMIISEDAGDPQSVQIDCGTITYCDDTDTLPGNHDIVNTHVNGQLTLTDAIVISDEPGPREAIVNKRVINDLMVALIPGVVKTINRSFEADGYQFSIQETWQASKLSDRMFRVRTDIAARIYSDGSYRETQYWMDYWDISRSSPELVLADVESSIGYVQRYCQLTPETDKFKSLSERLEEAVPYGDLTKEATDDVRLLDINSIAYVKDLSEVKSLIDTFMSIKDLNPTKLRPQEFKRYAKTLSGLYLAEHYGLRLSVQDTHEILDGFDDLNLFLTRRYGASKVISLTVPWAKTSVEAERRCTIDVDALSSQQAQLLTTAGEMKRTLYDLDVLPTAANLWDLVPYSFVADWFAPIGDYLEHREDVGYCQTLPLQAAFYSTKCRWTEEVNLQLSNGAGITGDVAYEVYYRICRPSLILPTFRADSPQGISNHWLEAAAIITQRLL